MQRSSSAKSQSFRVYKTIAEEAISQAKQLKGPKPENAPNRMLQELFDHKEFRSLEDPHVKAQVINFFKILNKRKIQITMLRSLAFRGVPTAVKPLRRIVWQLLIGYLPYETHKWETHTKAQKKIYDQWDYELIIRPDLRPEDVKQMTEYGGKDYGNVEDHPLSNG